MFDINQFNRVATGIAASDVKSTTIPEVLAAAKKAGKKYKAFKIAETNYGEKLIFGTFDENGFGVSGTDSLVFNVGSSKKPLILEGETDSAKLQELMQFPVYYGTASREVVETNELGEKTTSTKVSNWMTINVKGTLNSTPATAIDLDALISGKFATTAVA